MGVLRTNTCCVCSACCLTKRALLRECVRGAPPIAACFLAFSWASIFAIAAARWGSCFLLWITTGCCCCCCWLPEPTRACWAG